MKIWKPVLAIGVAAVLGAGLTACGTPYSGEGVVVSKDVDRSSSKSSSKRGSKMRSSTDYELTVDVPGSDVDRIFDVSKKKYDATSIGDKVVIDKGKVK